MDTPSTPFRSEPPAELEALEDPSVTAAFEALEQAQTPRRGKRTLKVSHIVLIAVVLVVLPALAVWALSPGL